MSERQGQKGNFRVQKKKKKQTRNREIVVEIKRKENLFLHTSKKITKLAEYSQADIKPKCLQSFHNFIKLPS